MSSTLELTVIIPSYLEEENLRIILPRLKSVLTQLQTSFEVLIVDTQTPMDQTSSVCLEQEVTYQNRLSGNYYGDAVRTGLQNAKGEYIIFMDADGSHSPEFIFQLWNRRKENDVVIASRYITGGKTDNSRILVLMSLIVNIIYSLVLNLNVRDVSNSFKLYRASSLRQVNLYCNNFDIVEELLYKMKKANPQLKITEVPFTFKERMFGHTKRNLFTFAISYFVSLIRLRFGK